MFASISQLADNVVTMRSFSDISRTDLFDRGPGTPDVVLHQARRPGSGARSSSNVGGKSTPPIVPIPLEHTPVSSSPSSHSSPLSFDDHHSHWRNKSFPTHLVMPSARRASTMVLNDQSPPLSPSNGNELDPLSCGIANGPYECSPIPSISFDGEGIYPSNSILRSEPHSPESKLSVIKPPAGQSSPPSSLESYAPSLTWSIQSSDSDFSPQMTLHGPRQSDMSLSSRIYQKLFSSTTTTVERADIDPSIRGWSWSLLWPHMSKLLLLGLTFLIATGLLGLCLSTLPLHLPKHLAQLTLSEIRDICESLQVYSHSSLLAMVHVFFVLSVFFTWKQAFCVPGSLIMNIVFGAMYGSYAGCFHASLLTAFGGALCYALASPFSDVVALFPRIARPLYSMSKALQAMNAPRTTEGAEHASSIRLDKDLWTSLLTLRLLPIVPYGMMNIACGVLSVPIIPYVVTLGVGSIPWNFCTTQIGELLLGVVTAIQASAAEAAEVNGSTVTSASGQASVLASGAMTILLQHVWTFDMMIKLTLLSIASFLPILLQRFFGFKKDLTARIEEGESEDNE